jgi:rubrerythrin
MYEQAVKEGHKAARMFKYALGAEAVHAALYILALKCAEEGKDLDTNEIYLCPVCGHIELGQPTEKCPICGTVAGRYVKI